MLVASARLLDRLSSQLAAIACGLGIDQTLEWTIESVGSDSVIACDLGIDQTPGLTVESVGCNPVIACDPET